MFSVIVSFFLLIQLLTSSHLARALQREINKPQEQAGPLETR